MVSIDHPELPTQPQISPSQWEWAQALIQDVEEQRKFDSLLYIWPFVTRQFQKLEVSQMRLQTPSPIDLKFHRQLELQAQKDPKQLPEQVRLIDIQAIIRSLQHSYDEFHSLEPDLASPLVQSLLIGSCSGRRRSDAAAEVGDSAAEAIVEEDGRFPAEQ